MFRLRQILVQVFYLPGARNQPFRPQPLRNRKIERSRHLLLLEVGTAVDCPPKAFGVARRLYRSAIADRTAFAGCEFFLANNCWRFVQETFESGRCAGLIMFRRERSSENF